MITRLVGMNVFAIKSAAPETELMTMFRGGKSRLIAANVAMCGDERHAALMEQSPINFRPPDSAQPDRMRVETFVHTDPEAWHELICRMFSQSEMTSKRTNQFTGSLQRTALGASKLSRIDASPLSYLRTQREIRHDHTDGFVVMLILKGEMRLSQNERRACARVGEALIYRQGCPFQIDFPDAYTAVTLWVPSAIMQMHCPGISNQLPFEMRSGSGNGRLALSLFQELAAVSMETDVTETPRLVGATLDVIATALPGLQLDSDMRNQLMVIARLRTYLHLNFEDAALNLDSLVKVSGMSARSLNRSFACQSTTPMRWVWSERLSAAYNALMQGRVQSVTEATFTFGFKDTSHFSRAFRSRFGISPSQLLSRS